MLEYFTITYMVHVGSIFIIGDNTISKTTLVKNLLTKGEIILFTKTVEDWINPIYIYSNLNMMYKVLDIYKSRYQWSINQNKNIPFSYIVIDNVLNEINDIEPDAKYENTDEIQLLLAYTYKWNIGFVITSKYMFFKNPTNIKQLNYIFIINKDLSIDQLKNIHKLYCTLDIVPQELFISYSQTIHHEILVVDRIYKRLYWFSIDYS